MKKCIFACLFLLLSSWNIFTLPVSDDGLLISADISADFLTIAELSNSSIWYKTVMPGYSLNCRYDYLTDKNKLHRFIFRLKYFESNSFRLNTAVLKAGDMRSLMFNIDADYNSYLPITDYIDYISGIELAGYYNSLGRIISSNAAKINESFNIKVGSINGFSVNMHDLFEFSSLLNLTGGLPLYGKIEYPDNIEKNAAFVDLGLSLRSSITFYIKMISLSLFYNRSQEYIMSLERYDETFNPVAIYSQSFNSIGLKVGIKI